MAAVWRTEIATPVAQIKPGASAPPAGVPGQLRVRILRAGRYDERNSVDRWILAHRDKWIDGLRW
ncbi:MAG: hypothetical protein WAW79_06035 [Steroidobacteraceae bacterium]